MSLSTQSGLSPRVRGNRQRRVAKIKDTRSGLSPRVRGNLAYAMIGHSRLILSRSIPACAGEPLHRFSSHSTADPVYPRVCGGTTIDYEIGIATVDGSIPACAGEPAYRRPVSRVCRLTVYPRVCGGTSRQWRCRACRQIKVYPRVCGGTKAGDDLA